MNDLPQLVDSQYVANLVAKARIGMESARETAAFPAALAGGCACAVKNGKYLADEHGNLYVEVAVERTVCREHMAFTSPLFAASLLFRLVINDRHEDSPAVQLVATVSARLILPRLHEVDIDDLVRCANVDICMM